MIRTAEDAERLLMVLLERNKKMTPTTMRSTPPSVVSPEYADECLVAGIVWQADIIDAFYTLDNHILRVNARLLRLTPGSPQEQWHLCFANCAAHYWQPIGVPGNIRLTRPEKKSAFASSTVIYEIKHSDWLPTCQLVGGAPGNLHHYVIVDDEENLALHVAATHVIGHRLEERDVEEGARQPLLPEASASTSTRG